MKRFKPKPYSLAVFLVIGLIFLGFSATGTRGAGESGVLGGPEDLPSLSVPPEQAPDGALLASLPTASDAAITGIVPPVDNSDGSLHGAASPFGFSGSQGAVITYSVRRGDTLSKIAQDFGVSVQTLINANPEVRSRALQIGQSLTVLPVSGILYRLKDGETIESVANTFHVPVRQLQEFNRSVNLASASAGTAIVVPGVAAADIALAGGTGSNLRSIPGYFIQPVDGWNWGILHKQNAVDIANACGTKVVAAAEGLVVDASDEGWNGGYGEYIILEHLNGTRTRYAHLSALAVSIGDYVKQGQKIGEVGRSGEATGCHLHFEVEGAANPFAKS